MKLPAPEIPSLARIRQPLSSRSIPNPGQELSMKLVQAGLKQRVRPGERIAITAGSRGFGRCVELLQSVAETVRRAGGVPVVVPAMGSHGGATAAGQSELLRALGITEDKVGASIQSSMETVCLGASESGATAHLDKIAHGCAGVIVLGRVKTHPENVQGIASGLLKMTTVGLGKQIGAQEAHSHGLWESIRAVPKRTLATGKVLFGAAVVENAFREPVAIEVVPGNYDSFREADERLLLTSKEHFARIPFTDLDLLIVDELGKNISGTGMDLNVIGPWRVRGGERKPDYKRIVVLSLTKESNGNGLGIGLADFTTERFRRAFDPMPTYINLLTATEPGTNNTVEAALPVVLPSDRAAIEAALYSTLSSQPKICRIKNTADLVELQVSPSLLELAQDQNCQIVEPASELRFDVEGNLV